MICINLAVKECQLSLLKRTKLFHVASRVNCRRHELRSQKFRVNPDVKLVQPQRRFARVAWRSPDVSGEKWRAWSYFSRLAFFDKKLSRPAATSGPDCTTAAIRLSAKSPSVVDMSLMRLMDVTIA